MFIAEHYSSLMGTCLLHIYARELSDNDPKLMGRAVEAGVVVTAQNFDVLFDFTCFGKCKEITSIFKLEVICVASEGHRVAGVS